MYDIINTIQASSAICDIKIVDGNIYLIDSSYLISVYSNKDFSLINKYSLFNDGDNRHIYDKTYTINLNLDIYISKYASNSGFLLSLDGGKLSKIDTLAIHDKAVTFAKFTNNGEILAIGDEDGKAFFYNLKINKLLISYSPRADAISNISFSKNNKYAAICSYDKTIIIYNIEGNIEIQEFELSDVAEDTLFTDNEEKLVGITRDKRLFTLDMLTGALSYADFIFSDWPTIIIEVRYHHYLIGTRGDSLYLVNAETLEVSQEIKMNSIGIKSLKVRDDNLYVGYIDGTLDIIDMLHYAKEFEMKLKVNKFAEATDLMDKNIFLLSHRAAKKYDLIWEQVLEIAKTHIIKKNFDTALKTVTPFFFDRRKKIEYNFLISNKDTYTRFYNLIKTQKDIAAFRLADDLEYLKDTKEYAHIEAKWNKVYQTCKLLFAKEDLESSQKAIDTLRLYSTIPSKKKGVENLIINYKYFIRAQKLVKSRNFKLYHKLVKNKPFLAEEELYKKVTQLGRQTYLKLLDLEQKEEFEKASTLAKYLEDFTELKTIASECSELINDKVQLKESISIDDTHAIYDAVESNKKLESFKSFMDYHDIFDEKKQKALFFAKDGNTSDVYNKLVSYSGIHYLTGSVALIFKLSYVIELENNAKMSFDSIHWQETIKKYERMYGHDNELLSFTKEFSLEEFLSNDPKVQKEKKLEDVEFLDTILVHK